MAGSGAGSSTTATGTGSWVTFERDFFLFGFGASFGSSFGSSFASSFGSSFGISFGVSFGGSGGSSRSTFGDFFLRDLFVSLSSSDEICRRDDLFLRCRLSLSVSLSSSDDTRRRDELLLLCDFVVASAMKLLCVLARREFTDGIVTEFGTGTTPIPLSVLTLRFSNKSKGSVGTSNSSLGSTDAFKSSSFNVRIGLR